MTTFHNIHTLKKESYKTAISGFVPPYVMVPLKQEQGDECKAIVFEGDILKEGQLIAESLDSSNSTGLKKYIYSPIPGKVLETELCTAPDGKIVRAMKIKLHGSFSFLGKRIKPRNLDIFSSSQLIREISEKGILNTFISDKPENLALQLENAAKNNNKILIVRLFDDDPSRLSDRLITSLYQEEVVKGSELIAKTMNAQGIVFICEESFIKSEKIKSIKTNFPVLFVPLNPKKYPCSFKKLVVPIVKKMSMGNGSFCKISVKDVFIDSSTAFETYNHISKGMPVIERYVLVDGDCTVASGLIKVPIGTTIDSLAEHCGGFIKKPGAIIINGLVTGFSVGTLNVPITKYVKSVTFVTSLKTPDQRMSVCVRCGSCRRSCPIKLSPDIIYRHITGGLCAEKEYLESSLMCIDCGLCNAVCPARLPLSQRINDFKIKYNEVR